MATIKSYTDIEQSKKLAGILPLESADMYYYTVNGDLYKTPNIIESGDDLYVDEKSIPCWSLVALLSVLPCGTRLLKSTNISSVGDTKYHCDCPKGNIDVWFDNPVDACVDMIEKLHELKMM